MSPSIMERDEFIVVGVRTVLEPGRETIDMLWREKVLSRLDELPPANNAYYTVFSPLPNDPQGRFEYVAGIMTDSLESIPGGMVGWIVPAGNYAMAEAIGSEEVAHVCRNIITDWLPDSGYKRVPAPMYACCRNGRPDEPGVIWEVNVPVETPELLAQLETWFA